MSILAGPADLGPLASQWETDIARRNAAEAEVLALRDALADANATILQLEAYITELEAAARWTPARLLDLIPRTFDPATDVHWDTLAVAGDDIRKVVAKVTGNKILRLPNGVYEYVDFSMTNFAGLRFGTAGGACRGIEGLGGTVVVRPKAGSSTKRGAAGANNIATSTGTNATNQLCFQSVVDPVLAMLTLEGTEQGHYYNGAQFYKCSGKLDTRGLRLVGASPGFANAPPGETFGLNIYLSHGMVPTDLEIDGRNRAGVRVSASPIGFNSSNDAGIERAHLHHGVAGMPTNWQGRNFYTKDVWSHSPATGSGGKSGHGINHERVTGLVEHTRLNVDLDLAANGGTTANSARAHSSLCNDQAVLDVTMIDPTWTPTEPGWAGCFAFWRPATYISVPNKASIPKVVIGGVALTPRVRYEPGWNVGLDKTKHFIVYG